tara:strand:- start:1130 stop:1339 length:210 start_codon:yes stop_codon:yes gene_type:complete
MSAFAIPQKYYEQEGFLSLMGIGYTAALAVTGLGLVNLVSNRDMSDVAIVGGGALATWGYLKASGVLYY